MKLTLKEIDKDFKKLLNTIKGYNHATNSVALNKAWKFARLAHTGQKRLTGDPYVVHALQTAKNLATWRLDDVSIISGILHDTVEDGGAKSPDLKKDFGEDVARIVDGVTKVSSLRLKERKKDESVENLRKLILVMAQDLRVVLVKLADRLHNMQTLYALPADKRVIIARETQELYAPLAERLGIGEIKGQLEDLAFPYLHPEEYKKVKLDSKLQYKKAKALIKKMKRSIYKKCLAEKIKTNIDGREKHLYSLWKKLERKEIAWDFDKIHDIVALRILVDEVPDCYSLLGIVHTLYKPVPKLGISDFIAQPKPNGYRSIHTKVFGPTGGIVEVQIRTHQMHEQAEFGVAAHWSYSQAKQKGASDKQLETGTIKASQSKLKWVKQLVKWQEEMNDSEEFLSAVKFDALSHRNFVFSPKGDVYDLPTGATPVDFAFAVHTGLGKHIKAAKVNGKLVPLHSKLKSGDVCEIIKTKNSKKPSRDWLDFVVTTAAKKGIKKRQV